MRDYTSKQIELVCPICGTHFKIRKSKADRGQVYCSYTCRGIAKRMPIPPVDDLKTLYATMSMNELSKHYGVCKQTIKSWFNSYGLSWRTRSESATKFWQSEERRINMSKIRLDEIQSGRSPKRSNGGKAADLGDVYYRSGWERNYARYLNFLQAQGEIERWEYEPETFIFHGVTRNPLSYTPDFRVWYSDGHYEWVEVKGWMDSKSSSKLKRFKKFYPDEFSKLILVEGAQYREIAKWRRLISSEWE